MLYADGITEERDKVYGMTEAQKAKQYAAEHPQSVSLFWVDGSKRDYSDAKKATILCTIPRTAACIMDAECEDKRLESMLNNLLNHGG